MKKILIIEDDHRLALALSVRLKANGYATWIAGDCITAVSTAIDIQPDLILLDVSLPAGNGFTLIEQFDRLPELSQTPIILATASKDPELRRKALDLGASGLLRKPYDPDELLGVVQEVLERWDGTTAVDFVTSGNPSNQRDSAHQAGCGSFGCFFAGGRRFCRCRKDSGAHSQSHPHHFFDGQQAFRFSTKSRAVGRSSILRKAIRGGSAAQRGTAGVGLN